MKLSFFKLPWFLVLCYGLFNFILYDIAIVHGTNNETETLMTSESVQLFRIFFIYNYYQLPNFLLIFIVSAISLHKFSIHQINRNNILYSLLIALLISVSINCFQVYIVRELYTFLVVNIKSFFHIYHQYSLSNLLIYLIFKLFIYAVTSLIIYFTIKLLSPFYTHTANFLTAQNSKKVHLFLFIALFNLIYFIVIFLLIENFDIESSMDANLDGIIIPFILLILFNIFNYLLVRKLFTNVTDKLRLVSLILCAIIGFILLLIATFFLVIISIIYFSVFYFGALTKVFDIMLFFLVDLFLLRICVKLFFSKKRGTTSLTAKPS